MADQVVLLRGGQIEQHDTPDGLYARPASEFAARFIGTPPMNLIGLAALQGATMIAGAQGPAVTGARRRGQAGRAPRTYPHRRRGPRGHRGKRGVLRRRLHRGLPHGRHQRRGRAWAGTCVPAPARRCACPGPTNNSISSPPIRRPSTRRALKRPPQERKHDMRRIVLKTLAASLAACLSLPAQAQQKPVEVEFYYPVAVAARSPRSSTTW